MTAPPDQNGDENGNNPSAHLQKCTGSVSLKVLIAGAGIGGLTAAIALRREGHEVHLYEQSQFAEEIGAAIHIVPNANGLLRRLGVHHEEKGAIPLIQTRYFDSKCNLLSTTPNHAERSRWQAGWLIAHRGHLHAHLKEVATSTHGDGQPVIIHTSSRVVNALPQSAEFVLQSGAVVRGAVIIGADGIRSACRPAVAGSGYESFSYGKDAFRFMIPRNKILEDPETKSLAEELGSMDFFFSPDHKVIVYPCVDNTLLNVVCIHPSQHAETSSDIYNRSASKESVIEVFREFDPRILKIIEKCDSDTLKSWPLLDAPSLPTYISDKLALIGDAAHPFTPFIGQGAAMAIEDAVSLGVMLSKGVTVAEVPERLKLYNAARFERATLIQGFSRIAGGDGVKPGEAKAAKMKSREHALYALSHEEYHYSTRLLQEHLWHKETKPIWLQPTVFGPSRRGSQSTPMMTVARVVFKTSGTLLQNLFPNKHYKFGVKDTVAIASLSVRSHENVDWLGGHSFHQVSFEVHGVTYTSDDGSVVRGRYMPVMFEDCPDAISANRETFGLPSIFAGIEVDKSVEDSYHIFLSWKGVRWATIWLNDLKLGTTTEGVRENSEEKDAGVMVHKYTPAIACTEDKGAPGTNHDILISESLGQTSANGGHVDQAMRKTKTSSNAGFSILPCEEQQIPTLYQVASHLRELPVFEIVDAVLEERRFCEEAREISRMKK